MPIKNRLQFFQTTLGLKEVSEGKQTYWVPFDYEAVPELQEFERLLSASRKAAYSAFSKKLDENQAPIFTVKDITEFMQHDNDPDYAMALLESLELTCLAQAIVHEDRFTVKAMLDLKPELLLFQSDCIVTSEYTGQRFGVDGNFLGLACRRKQTKMIKTLLKYFDKLQADTAEINMIRNAGLAEWTDYQCNKKGPIQIPVEYKLIIQDLVEAFNSVPIIDVMTDFLKLSDTVETLMTNLYERLLPDFNEPDLNQRTVLSKKNHLDIELLLYAAYQKYDPIFYSPFKTAVHRDAYCVRVIGILQRFLSVEPAKQYCAGEKSTVNLNQRVVNRVAELKLRDDIPFYSGDIATRSGMGFEYFCAGCRWAGVGGQIANVNNQPGQHGNGRDLFENSFQKKLISFRKWHAKFKLDQEEAAICMMPR